MSDGSALSIGFSAGPGYDQVTGLGSVDVTNLTNAWAGLTSTPDFTVVGYSATASAPGQLATSQIIGRIERWFQRHRESDLPADFHHGENHLLNHPTSVTVGYNGCNGDHDNLHNGASCILRVGIFSDAGSGMAGDERRTVWPESSCSADPRRRRRIAGLGVMLLVFFAAGVGCGGGGGGSNNNNNVNPELPQAATTSR